MTPMFLLALLRLGAGPVRGQSQANPAPQIQATNSMESGGGPQKRVTFLMPEDGAIVHPGDKIRVEVSLLSGVVVDRMGLIGTLGVAEEIRERPPYSFTLNVPDTELTSNSHLIGLHDINAWGGMKGRNGEELGFTTVDVEMPDLPVKLEVADGLMSQYNRMSFDEVGAERHLSVYGTFADGKELQLRDSTYLKLSSGNTAIIRVFDHETVMSAGPGRTTLIASYAFGEKTMQATVPVEVEVPSTGLTSSPWSVDFGDIVVGSTSQSQIVTITNQTESPVRISKFEMKGIFKEWDNCTEVPLRASGGTCTFNVTFSPDRIGSQHLRVSLSNNPYSGPSFLLVGNGV
jgi:hypothetical protein